MLHEEVQGEEVVIVSLRAKAEDAVCHKKDFDTDIWSHDYEWSGNLDTTNGGDGRRELEDKAGGLSIVIS
jgi:hypothetical protein